MRFYGPTELWVVLNFMKSCSPKNNFDFISRGRKLEGEWLKSESVVKVKNPFGWNFRELFE